jgi:hypothetical protein
MIPRMMTLVAPDKFKGTYSAAEVADAICAVLGPNADRCPVADGGDGTAEVLLEATGGRWVEADAHDALGEPIRARFALLGDGEEAVVEVAEASGLARLAGRPLRPLEASSEGTGELIAAAISAGAKRVLVACGGSATTDASTLRRPSCSASATSRMRLPVRFATRPRRERGRGSWPSWRRGSGRSQRSCPTIPRGFRSPVPPAASPAGSGRTAHGSSPAPAMSSRPSTSIGGSARRTR